MACASKPPAKPPDWTSLPALVPEALCARIHSEAISREAPVSIVTTTQPLVTGTSILSLAHAYFKQTPIAIQAADRIASTLEALPVNVPDKGSCIFQKVDSAEQRRGSDTLLLQLSSPFVNPFARNEAGLFARVSLGGHDSSWYWLPLAEREGEWFIGNVLLLDIHEE